MAKVTRVSMSIGRTVNLGNYESFRMEITAESIMKEGEKPNEVLNDLEKGILSELETRIQSNVKILRS